MVIQPGYSRIALALLAVTMVLGGCTDSAGPISQKNRDGKSREMLSSLPDIENADHHFYAGRSSASISMSNFTDPELQQLLQAQGKSTVEQDWAGQALAYFMDGTEGADGLWLNGQPYNQVQTADGKICYDLGDAESSSEGNHNTFEWVRNGERHHHVFGPATPDVVISSPGFNSYIDGSQPLTVTWDPSSGDDFVQITVRGKLNSDSPEGTEVGFLESGYIRDDGSYTFDGLERFAELGNTSATITVTRGAYQEAEYGGESYLFIIYSQKSIDINL